jgi:hypothetical protein
MQQAELIISFSPTTVSFDESEAFFAVPVISSYRLQATDRKAHLVWLKYGLTWHGDKLTTLLANHGGAGMHPSPNLSHELSPPAHASTLHKTITTASEWPERGTGFNLLHGQI